MPGPGGSRVWVFDFTFRQTARSHYTLVSGEHTRSPHHEGPHAALPGPMAGHALAGGSTSAPMASASASVTDVKRMRVSEPAPSRSVATTLP